MCKNREGLLGLALTKVKAKNGRGGYFVGLTITVKDAMTKNVISVKAWDPVKKAIAVMVERDIGSVLVTEGEKPVGILTERDIMKNVCPSELCSRQVEVGEIMSKPLITIEPEARLGEAAALMVEKGVRRLLVTKNGQTVGIITQRDLLKRTIDTFIALTMA